MVESRTISNDEFKTAWENKDNNRIIHAVLTRYRASIPQDELEELGMVGLFRALKGHDYNHISGQKFTTSLYNFVEWECRKYLRYHQRVKEKGFLTSIEADIVEQEEPGEKSESLTHINECLKWLSNSQRQIIQQYFFENLSTEEISRQRGCSKGAVNMQLRKSIARLKEICLEPVGVLA